MPQSIEDYSTEQILNFADGSVDSEFTVSQCIAELKSRTISEHDDPEDLGYRGGVRPTHQPVNP